MYIHCCHYSSFDILKGTEWKKIKIGEGVKKTTQAALMLDSGRFNLQANTDKIQLKHPFHG